MNTELSDEALARLLQDQEYSDAKHRAEDTKTKASETSLGADAPFKDLHGLFLAFNDLYFDSKLSACEVRWSPRMTVCAGLCVYQSGGYCSIRLSEPLLKFRPESDYIDTLLHEMIHAYLFVTQAVQDRDGHGPNFQLHMDRINKVAGTSITVYHTFHDEVRYYKTHVWKCNGPCQHKPPYFGTVRRSMNRPPQPADSWFAEHQTTCGGTYTKISEPEPKKKPSSSNPSKEHPKPKGRTLLDNYLTGNNNKVKDASSSSRSPTLSTTSTASQSTTTSPDTSSREKTKSGNVREPIVLDDDDTSDFMSGKAQGGSLLVPTPQEPSGISPREAAAAAAIARFEKQMRPKNGKFSSPSVALAGPARTTAPTRTTVPTRTTEPIQIPPTRTTEASPTSKTVIRKRAILIDSDTEDEYDPYCEQISVGPRISDQKRPKMGDNQKSLSTSRNVISSPSSFSSSSVSSEGLTDNGSIDVGKKDSTATSLSHHRPRELEPSSEKVQCPVCSDLVLALTINDHVDLCIWRTSGEIED